MRLFVAVWPSADVVSRLEALDRPASEGVRWTGPDQWHVTLRFFGWVPDEGDQQTVRDVLSRVARSWTGGLLALTVGPETACFGRTVLQVPVTGAGLDTLAAAVVEATADVGQPPEDRAFSGHLTLARSGSRGRGRGGRRQEFDLRQFAGIEVAAAFAVDELTLVRSHTSRAGARYEVLDRYRLASA